MSSLDLKNMGNGSVIVVEMVMKTLRHLSEDQKQHFAKCPVCKHYFDMRDLNDVFLHEHYLPRIPKLPFTHSLKKGVPIVYYRNEHQIILN